MDSSENSDGDDGTPERCSSVRSVQELSFEEVPETKDFKLKFIGPGCSKGGTKIIFTLKEGKKLPYTAKVISKKGLGSHFLQELI